MQIIIAPAKKMVINTNDFEIQDLPIYIEETRQILQKMQTFSYEEAHNMWRCSDKLARPNYAWLQKMNLSDQLTPAIISYTGIQYQYMAPDLFTAPALAYVQANLRILSGFYGILRPFDGVTPYRLEMQAAIQVAGTRNLYQFWGQRLYQALSFDQGPVLNLASQEYAKTITRYLQPNDQLVDVVFGSEVAGKLKTKATLAKMARGEMVRYLAEHNIQDIAGVTHFDHPDWRFDAQRSTQDKLVFINNERRH
ncbi:peroxide stress protein YaaA [Secundilactobacillus silagei]|uniref:UPF0246 protein IWT126_00574 n=1 Tax=Secundilactobacillus silagei JCM 19001 TaxID=1302250 RepID=A0A1Z5IFW9_9LACO|nr:peroxide stress protein YaaA [Secundilactobacillus silagei]TDG72003.1 hypothetical protein C5L25_002387 [Secundilactobacillus silagei JCM 19001]GAX00559.1 hypothetical protein IWT126_00574 [Secundilactobacillus silagei JCM 19001]